MYIKGKKVVDTKSPLILTITKGDVRAGKKKAPDACAAAVAATRQCKGALAAHVHLSRTYIEYPDKIVRYQTPQVLRTEIVSFDRGHRFEAGQYELQVPPHPLGTDKGGNQTRPNRDRSKENPRAAYHILTGVRAHAPKKTDWK